MTLYTLVFYIYFKQQADTMMKDHDQYFGTISVYKYSTHVFVVFAEYILKYFVKIKFRRKKGHKIRNEEGAIKDLFGLKYH